MTTLDSGSLKYNRMRGVLYGNNLIALVAFGLCIFLYAVFHESFHTTSLASVSLLLQEFESTRDESGDELTIALVPKDVRIAPEKVEMDDVLLYMQKPQGKLQGITLLFHGCHHDGIDWFILPESKKIVKYLLSKQQAVVAFSSHHRKGTKCWGDEFPAHHNHDARKINKMFHKFIAQKFGKKGSRLPLYGIGSSSGGNFVSILNEEIPFHGLSIIVSPGNMNAWKWINKQPSILPRVAFVHMPKDARFASSSKMRRRERELDNHAVKVFSCEPKPITASDLTSNVSGLKFEEADTIIKALSSEPISILDPQTNMFVEDPRSIWDALEENLLSKLSEVQILSLQELFNVAYGVHETTSEHMDEVFAFWTAKDVPPSKTEAN